MPRDYYEVLGVGRDADEAQIKKSFRRLARELHPDRNNDPQAEEHFKELAAAYEVLSDAERRRQYDMYGHEGVRSGGYAPNFEGFGSFSDIFSAFFGAGGFDTAFGRGAGSRAAQGADVAVAVGIDLAEAASGAGVEVVYDVETHCHTCHGNGAQPGTPIVTCPRCRGTGQLQMVSRTAFGQMVRTAVCDECGGDGKIPEQPCETCGGSGRVHEERRIRVDVPAGIADSQRIRLSGRGHAGAHGGPAGDLYVVVRVREDERFIRDGDDLLTVVDVPAPLAALGTTVEVETLEEPVPLQIPAGTQPGEEFVLKGHGMPPLHGGRSGNLRVFANVAIPRRLNREQRELLERFAATLSEDHMRSDEGVLAKLRRLVGAGAR
jgi:molecular chaperone DnaJ